MPDHAPPVVVPRRRRLPPAPTAPPAADRHDLRRLLAGAVAARQPPGPRSARSRSGSSPGSCCRIATSVWVSSSSSPRRVRVLLASSRNCRDPFTLTCAASASRCRPSSSSATRSGSPSSACWPAPASARSGWCVAARCRPSCSRSCRGRWLGLRGLPWLGRTLRLVTGLGNKAALARTALFSCHRARRLRTALRVGRRAVRRVGRRRRTRPRVGGPGAAHVRRVLRRRSRARRRLPGPQPADDRSGERAPRPGRPPLRVARACARRRRRLRALPARAGRGHLRWPRLPRADHRADLRRVRPPGLRPAHRGNRTHPARRVGGDPQGTARHPRRPGLDPRLARTAVRRHPGGRRVRALPDERLPGRLRLHPAPAAGRRLRGLARPAGARDDGRRPCPARHLAAPVRAAHRRRRPARLWPR